MFTRQSRRPQSHAYLFEVLDFAFAALVILGLFATVANTPADHTTAAAPASVAPTHVQVASRPAINPALLRIHPKKRPWYGYTDGDWAARLGECLQLPAKTLDNLHGYHRGLAPVQDFLHMYVYRLVRVSAAGNCSPVGSKVIRDLPKLGYQWIGAIGNRPFTALYVVELPSDPGKSRLFAYRTE